MKKGPKYITFYNSVTALPAREKLHVYHVLRANAIVTWRLRLHVYTVYTQLNLHNSDIAFVLPDEKVIACMFPFVSTGKTHSCILFQNCTRNHPIASCGQYSKFPIIIYMEHPNWRNYKESKQTLILHSGVTSSKSTDQSGFNMLWNQNKTGSGDAASIWGGLPQYLTDEPESIQTRSLKILGLPSDSLQSLEQRRDNLYFDSPQREIAPVLTRFHCIRSGHDHYINSFYILLNKTFCNYHF
jgi:hypothetical protein